MSGASMIGLDEHAFDNACASSKEYPVFSIDCSIRFGSEVCSGEMIGSSLINREQSSCSSTKMPLSSTASSSLSAGVSSSSPTASSSREPQGTHHQK